MTTRRRNVTAYERTVKAYRVLGRIDPQDAALVALGRTLAEKLDGGDDAPTQVAWAYLGVLRQLRGEVSSATASDDDLAAWLAVLRSQVGDAADT